MKRNAEARVIESWKKNATAWIRAVQNREIESRRLVTDQAIVETIMRLRPTSALDVGCGEGWLTRALSAHGVTTHGIDVIPALIETAQRQGGGSFQVLSYDELSYRALQEKFDVVACNFSLFGDASVESVFRAAPAFLTPGGALVVQTLHPAADHSAHRAEGWRPGSWTGFSSDFVDPAPWYFRTREGWEALYRRNGFDVAEVQELTHPQTGKFISIIFVGKTLPGKHAAAEATSLTGTNHALFSPHRTWMSSHPDNTSGCRDVSLASFPLECRGRTYSIAVGGWIPVTAY